MEDFYDDVMAKQNKVFEIESQKPITRRYNMAKGSGGDSNYWSLTENKMTEFAVEGTTPFVHNETGSEGSANDILNSIAGNDPDSGDIFKNIKMTPTTDTGLGDSWVFILSGKDEDGKIWQAPVVNQSRSFKTQSAELVERGLEDTFTTQYADSNAANVANQLFKLYVGTQHGGEFNNLQLGSLPVGKSVTLKASNGTSLMKFSRIESGFKASLPSTGNDMVGGTRKSHTYDSVESLQSAYGNWLYRVNKSQSN